MKKLGRRRWKQASGYHRQGRTLIDGDKLIDLLIEHGIGVRKRTLEVLTVDPDAFDDVDDDA